MQTITGSFCGIIGFFLKLSPPFTWDTKKSRNLFGQKKITQPHVTKKSPNLSGQKKSLNLLGQKNVTQPLWTKNSPNLNVHGGVENPPTLVTKPLGTQKKEPRPTNVSSISSSAGVKFIGLA